MKIVSRVAVLPGRVELNGKILNFESCASGLLEEIYRKEIGDWPKFFKMDPLARLGFVASELLLKGDPARECSDRAIILIGQSSSLADDKAYQETIEDMDNYYPSPAVFVYTLPNIVTGEIAIRRKYYGETSFYVLDGKDPETIYNLVDQAFMDPGTTSVLAGWLDCMSESEYEARLFLAEKEGPDSVEEIKHILGYGRT